MDDKLTIWQCILIVWVLFGGFAGTLVQTIIFCDEIDIKDIRSSVAIAKKTWENLDGEVNIVGRIIATSVVEILLLPGTILTTIIVLILNLSILFWKGFKYLFRVHKENNDE